MIHSFMITVLSSSSSSHLSSQTSCQTNCLLDHLSAGTLRPSSHPLTFRSDQEPQRPGNLFRPSHIKAGGDQNQTRIKTKTRPHHHLHPICDVGQARDIITLDSTPRTDPEVTVIPDLLWSLIKTVHYWASCPLKRCRAVTLLSMWGRTAWRRHWGRDRQVKITLIALLLIFIDSFRNTVLLCCY